MLHNSRDNEISIVMLASIFLPPTVDTGPTSVVKLSNVSAYGGIILLSFVLSMHIRKMVFKKSYLVVKSNGFLVYASQVALVRQSGYP